MKKVNKRKLILPVARSSDVLSLVKIFPTGFVARKKFLVSNNEFLNKHITYLLTNLNRVKQYVQNHINYVHQ